MYARIKPRTDLADERPRLGNGEVANSILAGGIIKSSQILWIFCVG
ncbi:MAG: hypothetical protein JSS34_08060 [Proteobacteria bacterium]|nr:hypothetical protein [Pseudomonadota bacterium]